MVAQCFVPYQVDALCLGSMSITTQVCQKFSFGDKIHKYQLIVF